MSRKPVDQQQPSECRQAVWDEIRSRGESALFTMGEIAKCVRLDPSSVREYMTGLLNAGYLGVHTIRRALDAGNILFLERDTGHEAPRVRKDGTPVTQGQGQQHMWNAMRILKTFSAADLAFNSTTDDITVSTSTAKTYCNALAKAGYLVEKPGGRFMLIAARWSGPQPPQIQRTKQVYDPNLHKVVWFRVEGGAL